MNTKLFNKLLLLKSIQDFEVLQELDMMHIKGGNNCQKLKSCGTFSSNTKVKHPNPILVSCSNYTLNGKKIVL